VIFIGCYRKTIPEWDTWFASDEVYETERDTEAFRLIHAAYLAIRAYALAMEEVQTHKITEVKS